MTRFNTQKFFKFDFKFFGLALLFMGCISVDKETTVNVDFANQTDSNIKVELYPTSPQQPDTLWFILTPDAKVTAASMTDQGELDVFMPAVLFPLSGYAASAVVIFDDSLRVTHCTKIYSRKDSTAFSSNAIKFGDERNIFNPSHFLVTKVNALFYETLYYFTTDDLEYAIQINE